MTVGMDDPEEFGASAPRPVDAESVSRGSFERLGEGQGVVAARRAVSSADGDTWQDGLPVSKRTLGIMVVAALVAVAVIVSLVIRALDAPVPPVGEQPMVEQTMVSGDQSIAYRGSVYSFASNEGMYQLVENREDGAGQQVVLGDLRGEPVALVLFDGALVVPENLSGGSWDVVAYTIGSGWSQLMDQGGNMQAGKGTISQALLSDSTLTLTIDNAEVSVPLVW